MVKINGVKAEIVEDNKTIKNVTPSINEVLDRMDSNYRQRQNDFQSSIQSQKTTNQQNAFGDIFSNLFSNSTSQNQNSVGAMSTTNFDEAQNGNAEGNWFMTFLPLLLSGNKNKKMGFDNPIFKEFIKKINNPMLQKIFELMPKFSKKEETQSNEDSQRPEKKEKARIDGYIKTDEFEQKILEK